MGAALTVALSVAIRDQHPAAALAGRDLGALAGAPIAGSFSPGDQTLIAPAPPADLSGATVPAGPVQGAPAVPPLSGQPVTAGRSLGISSATTVGSGAAALSADKVAPAAPSLPSLAPILAVGQATPAGRVGRAAALPEVPIAAAGATARSQAAAVAQTGDKPVAASGTPNPSAVQYVDHTIGTGETLHSIADSHGVTVAAVIANNQGVSDFDAIRPGQTLRIPSTDGIVYSVRQGDTLADISRRYGVSPADLTKVEANNLQNADEIHPGQTLLIPKEVQQATPQPAPLARPLVVPAAPPAAAPALALPNRPPAQAPAAAPQAPAAPKPLVPPATPVPSSKPVAAAPKPVVPPAAATPAPTPKPLQPPAPAAPAPPPAPTAAPKPLAPPPTPPQPTAVPVVTHFIWPISGPITQGFGVPELGYGAPHTGIDIGLYGRDGEAIGAAGPGTVIFSGGDACCSYGYYVIIAHPGGLTSLYGHLSRRAVSVGQVVTAGQVIAYAGSTGYSTGTHLHFEVHFNGVTVNPLTYLP
ncbi:MAG: peptidoglycan DD-metalloendopeptidase family protein [Dehalococcoidia bacterium]